MKTTTNTNTNNQAAREERPLFRVTLVVNPGASNDGRRAVEIGDGLYMDEFGFLGPAHMLG
jgi:hypothetical protein